MKCRIIWKFKWEKNNKRAFFGKKSVSGAMRSEMEENKKNVRINKIVQWNSIDLKQFKSFLK